MRLFSLLLSIAVFFVSLYFLVQEFPVSGDINDLIYIALLVILMIICVVGVIINWSLLKKRSNTMVFFVSNSFSVKKHR